MRPKRFLGADISGARNTKTTVCVLEYYPKEKKIFLLDLYTQIQAVSGESQDQALLALIQEILENTDREQSALALNVPLTLPPCIACTITTCPFPSTCKVTEVKWMRFYLGNQDPSALTPYTQRPVETFVRHQILSHLPKELRFDVDEAMGGNKAPLTSRVHFLKRHLGHLILNEVWPKLTFAALAYRYKIPKRISENVRSLEEGYAARLEAIEIFTRKLGVFIYERDRLKLSQNLSSFDAFLCAITLYLKEIDQTQVPPRSFRSGQGWVEFPKIERE